MTTTARTTPVRRCALTRARRPKDELIRFVLGPDGTVVPDLKEKLPGRGVWLTAAQDTVAEAAKRNVFARALKTASQGARRACRSGRPAAGRRGAVGAWPCQQGRRGGVRPRQGRGGASPKAACSPSSTPGKRRKTVAASLTAKPAECATGGPIPAIRAFGTDELSLASGRTNVIHAALIQGGAARKFLAAASRLERYRKGRAAFATQNGSDTDKE